MEGLYASLCTGNAAQACYIAPFSTLGKADSWSEDKWKELADQLQQPVSLLALQQDREQAEAMAARLGIPCVITTPHELAQHVGPATQIYAVDGLLPHLAAAAGATCTVLMAGRLAERHGICLGDGHKHVCNHMPCHPCHRKDCDMQPHCTEDITVEQMLGKS